MMVPAIGGVQDGNYTTMTTTHPTHQSQITAHRTHAYTTGPAYTTATGIQDSQLQAGAELCKIQIKLQS